MTTSSNAELRTIARNSRRALSDDYRDLASARIQRSFLRSNLFLSANNIACYIAMQDEVDTRLIFDRAWCAGKSIFAPVVADKRQLRFVRVERATQLEKSRFGVWEPVTGAEISKNDLDVILTPLVVFDPQWHRIGMGGGYYDRTFSFLKHKRHWLRPKLVGLAFDCQKVEKILPNPWDIRLYRVFNESR
ncbi:MAG: 5-formyltetrahydrofolate cyclo-ligase [Gammaproteobacteria bacterium]|nr:5-formyltetrahydrofolate cyclo-ligase [Gammaproteobacteria bacterium]